ncbi:MAG: helix-turn-helix domain-containing protein, partial [Chloroflexota bacterium]
MTRGLTPEDRRRVEELYKEGHTPAEIGHETGKDARTVKSYLAKLEVGRVPELVRLQDLQKHWEIIRDRVKSLKEALTFPPPEHLDISDLSVGQRAYCLERGVIRWHEAGSSYRVKLGEEFDCVLEHLRSSRRTSILKRLEQWQSIGGKCIEDCHRLQAHIVEEAKRETD